ncbi:MAG: hypothetical protein IBJ10_09180 [Phycisphaerales bacterium]|nr:hypothetical protein [Phycisphaerales bacterium]
MRADHLTYRRATFISLLGLAIQVALALVFLLYALFSRDAAALTAAVYTALGVIVWLGLALPFPQPPLDRLESIEADAFAEASASQASVFEGIQDELKVAARRLAWMHRILTPALSILVGLALIGVGLARFFPGKAALNPDEYPTPSLTGWAIATGLTAGVIGFIFARFVAGMAKQKEWAALSSGASYLVGVSLAGLALAISHFVAFLGNDVVLRYVTVGLPLFMALLGGEILFNFVLNIYRPRRAGEAPRPAFDSRLLGFLSAPDRLAESVGEAISYQFGFDVTTSWFYRLLSRTVLLLALFGAALLWGLSSLAVVRPEEKGLILRFGALRAEVESGLHFKLPWPIEHLETYPALAVNELQVGTQPPTTQGPIIWTSPHVDVGREVLMIVQPDGDGAGARDLAVIAAEIPVHYRVKDMRAFEEFAPPAMRRDLLTSIASRQVIEELANRRAGEVLGAGRAEIGESLRARIEAAFDTLNAGVHVMFVGVVGAHPPMDQQVAQTYERVVSVEQARETEIERARADAIRTLTRVAGNVDLAREVVRELDNLERLSESDSGDARAAEQELKIEALIARAGGEAQSLIASARADRWTRHMAERARAARHAGRVAAYSASPAVFRVGEYLNALTDMSRNARVYITAFTDPRVRLNLEDNPDLGGLPQAVTPREE